MQFGLFTLKLKLGKLENTVIDGTCNNFTEFSFTSEAMAKISDEGLNFKSVTEVVKLRTIFSGLGLVLDQHVFLL